MTPTQYVYIARHTYDAFEVVAIDMFGQCIRRRMYLHGQRRQRWAIQQAEQWADELYLHFDRSITR